MKNIGKFLEGVNDLMAMDVVEFEELVRADKSIACNFCTAVHEYSVALDWSADPVGILELVVWHGSGESNIADGPVSEETWEAFKVAIEKGDKECGYCMPQVFEL